jgi:CheY-like chemotaxis protein
MEAELENKFLQFVSNNFKLKKIDVIILVDDDPTDIFVNKAVIEHLGLSSEIVVQKSGKDGLEYLEKECASIKNKNVLILLDFTMPGFDGIDFIKEFEKKYTHTNIAIALLTALEDPNYLVKLKGLGNYDVLTKPLTLENFENLHHKFFRNKFLVKAGKNVHEIKLFK